MGVLNRAGKSALLQIRKTMKIFTRLDREVLSSRYLKGTGIEIGGLHNPLRVPKGATVKYVDRMTVTDLRKHYPELASEKLTDVDIIADGETLSTIGDCTQDFVIANHFLEHCENPILALENMFRVMKTGGVLYLGIPDKRFTFDSGREVTSFDHCLRDYREGPAWSREGHFHDWVVTVDNTPEKDKAAQRVKELMAMNYSIHYHVWTQTEMMQLLLGMREATSVLFDLDAFLMNEGEAIFILRKTGIPA